MKRSEIIYIIDHIIYDNTCYVSGRLDVSTEELSDLILNAVEKAGMSPPSLPGEYGVIKGSWEDENE